MSAQLQMLCVVCNLAHAMIIYLEIISVTLAQVACDPPLMAGNVFKHVASCFQAQSPLQFCDFGDNF